MTEKELEDRIREVGNRLASLPSALDELTALLNQTERFLARVEQSPVESMSNSLQPVRTSLVARGLLEHSDLDVKILITSCISEITRITAPEAPYDDDLMKEIFEKIVGAFEHLNDVSSHTFHRRVSILETVAKVRSCVVMLDLECDALILKMFRHFLKTLRPENAELVFSSMETIMALVLEESEDISSELISCLLSSVKVDNTDILPVARELGEKVMTKCAEKLKPYLRALFQSMNLRDYSPVIASICQDTSDVLEQHDMAISDDSMSDDSKQSEQTISDELLQDSGKIGQEEGCAEEAIHEKLPGKGTNKGNYMVNGNPSVEPSSPKQKSEHSRRADTQKKVAAVGKKGFDSLEPVDEYPDNAPDTSPKKVKSRPARVSCSMKKERDGHGNGVESCSRNELKVPVVADNGTLKLSLSSKVDTPDSVQCKRGRPSSKVSSKKDGTNDANKHKSSTWQKNIERNQKSISSRRSEKEFDNASDSEHNPLMHHNEKEPNTAANAAQATENVTSPPEDKSLKQSNRKTSLSKAPQGLSSQKQHKSSSKQQDKPKPEKDKDEELPLKEMMSSGKKAHKIQGKPEENIKMKSGSKHVRGAEESPATPPLHKKLDECLVGSRIKVWWPDDKEYYQGTVESYDPSSKKHKILYDDGDTETLSMKRERWDLLYSDDEKRQAEDNCNPDASPEEPRSKRTKLSSSSVLKGNNRVANSDTPKRKGRPPKGLGLAKDTPSDSGKAMGKSTPSDSGKAIGKSGTRKDATVKSKTRSKMIDAASANTPKGSSMSKDGSGSKGRKEIHGYKSSKDRPAVGRKSKMLGLHREKKSKISES